MCGCWARRGSSCRRRHVMALIEPTGGTVSPRTTILAIYAGYACPVASPVSGPVRALAARGIFDAACYRR